MTKTRLDILLTERGLAESRTKAQALIMAGQVRVDGQTALKAGASVSAESMLTVDAGPRFVSRGGEKLDAALETLALDVRDLTCVDVGSSTGGFTDCLLQRGELTSDPAISAYVTPVAVGDAEGEYVRGVWEYASPNTTTPTWNPRADSYSLTWQKDSFALYIHFLGGETVPPISLTELIMIAESLK